MDRLSESVSSLSSNRAANLKKNPWGFLWGISLFSLTMVKNGQNAKFCQKFILTFFPLREQIPGDLICK